MAAKVKKKKGMVLTEDDQKLLARLYDLRYAQTRQFYVLFPHRSEQGIRHRLRLLKSHDLIHCFDRTLRTGIITDNVYCLTNVGLRVLSQHLGVPFETLRRQHRVSASSSVYLAHYILSNDIRIAAEVALKDHPHLELAQWFSEYSLNDDGVPVTDKEGRFLLKQELRAGNGKRYFWSPDGAFLIHPHNQPDKKLLYCVEADRSTETMKRIKDKVIGYELFSERKGREQLGARWLRVLWVVEGSLDRLENMRAVMEGSPVRFLLTTAPLEPDNFFDASVWMDQQGSKTTLYRPNPNPIP